MDAVEAPAGPEVVLWESELGRRWAGALTDAGIGAASTLVEVAPGYSMKVGRGLAEIGFAGDLGLVDTNERALAAAVSNYRHLLPGANVVPGRPTGRPDALLANHVLDDFVFGAHVPRPVAERLFGAMYPGLGCSTEYVAAWSSLLSDPALLDRAIDSALGEVVRIVGALRPVVVVMNHYPSWSQTGAGLFAVHDVGLKALGLLAHRLTYELGRNAHVERAGGDEMYWLVSWTGPDDDGGFAGGGR